MRGLPGYDAPYSLGAMVAHDFGIGEVLAGLSVAGSLLSAGGAIASGNATAEQQKYQAQQQDMKAAEERASASRDAAELGKRQALVTSRQQALAASQGGSATDPSILDLMGDTAQQGYLQRQTRLGLGENAARGYEDAAAMSRFNAKNARTAGTIGAISSLIAAPSAAFQAYGSAMPRHYDPYTGQPYASSALPQ